MKEIIEYYYKINDFIINDRDGKFILLYKNELYIVEKIIDIEMLNSILKYSSVFPMYKVIFTIMGKIYFEYENDKYVLYKALDVSKNINDNFIFFIVNNEQVTNNTSIWEHNIDYYKKEISKLNYHEINLIDNINYYIGMAENAICLYNIGDKIEMPIRITLSHYRINCPNISLFYYNPNNIVIDCISRDIAEYIKISFFYGKMSLEEAFVLINKYNLNDKEVYYLLARLMYPSYFFDSITTSSVKLSNIVSKRNDYQLFIKELIKQLKTANTNINISWL